MNNVLEDVGEKESIKHECFRFNGGEYHIKIDTSTPIEDDVTIEWYANNPEEVLSVALAVDALRNIEAGCISLVMPYVPFSRQDRVMVKGEPLSIKVFSNIINSLELEAVYTLDNHSPVTTALINNCIEINRSRLVAEFVCGSTKKDVLISPDAGAIKKTYDIAKLFDMPVVTCSKLRDVRSGEIIGLDVHSGDLHGADCYIIDDICDGGRTFIEIAAKLKTLNCGKLHLYVSHGIFSMGQYKLEDYYTTINCTMLRRLQAEVPKIKTIPLRKEDLR